jgi:hypothetical protein
MNVIAGDDYEIVLVNDSLPDRSGPLAIKLCRKNITS